VSKESSPSPLYDALSLFFFPGVATFSSSDHTRPSLLLFIHVSIIRCAQARYDGWKLGTIGMRKSRGSDERAAMAAELGACACRLRHGVLHGTYKSLTDVVRHVKFCWHRKIWILSMYNICSARRVRAQAYQGSARVEAGGTLVRKERKEEKKRDAAATKCCPDLQTSQSIALHCSERSTVVAKPV
jgi:hypothetical protein